MAMISLNLGLLNLLPVPVLDGGHIAILAVEGVARRDLSVRVKERILMAGAALIVLLMVTVIYNDIDAAASGSGQVREFDEVRRVPRFDGLRRCRLVEPAETCRTRVYFFLRIGYVFASDQRLVQIIPRREPVV